MSLKTFGSITPNTWVPISSLVLIFVVAMWIGSLASKVEAMETKNSPTRAEFDKLSDDTSYIRGKIDEVVLKAKQ